MITSSLPVREMSPVPVPVPLSRQTCILHVFTRVYSYYPDLCSRKISKRTILLFLPPWSIGHCRQAATNDMPPIYCAAYGAAK